MKHANQLVNQQAVSGCCYVGKTDDDRGSVVKEAEEGKKRRQKNKDTDISKILSGAVESMGQLVHAVVDHKASANNADKEPEDDDWLFCKRLYLTLKKLPDSQHKELCKLNIESELIRMTYGTTSMQSGSNADNGMMGLLHCGQSQYTLSQGVAHWQH